MSDLKTSLERIAEAGVSGIALRALQEPRAQRRPRTRTIVAAIAGMCILVAAVGVAIAVRSTERRPQPRGKPTLVANASYKVRAVGMSPTLQVGDVVSATTHFGAIERGDVVLERFPRNETPPGVNIAIGGGTGFERVVGVPGDAIQGRNGHVLVDGRQLTEPYLHVATSDFARLIVPPDAYFLLGDNRPNSHDSRLRGPIPRSQIIAIALRITAPTARAGPIAGSAH